MPTTRPQEVTARCNGKLRDATVSRPEPAARRPCIGCGGAVPDIAGPTHSYMRSSPGCWATYGEVCAQVFGPEGRASDGRHMDCYAVQHSGGAERVVPRSSVRHPHRAGDSDPNPDEPHRPTATRSQPVALPSAANSISNYHSGRRPYPGKRRPPDRADRAVGGRYLVGLGRPSRHGSRVDSGRRPDPAMTSTSASPQPYTETTCPGCGRVATGEPTTPTERASLACQASCGALLALSYSNPAYRIVHQLIVDAYATQHPAGTERRQVQAWRCP